MINRRSFVQLSSAAAAATLAGQSRAAEPLPALPTDNPQAVALKYVEDASEGGTAGQLCSNCTHYNALDDTWGSCALFPGFKVKGPGWCAAWVAKA